MNKIQINLFSNFKVFQLAWSHLVICQKNTSSHPTTRPSIYQAVYKQSYFYLLE
jgi:hypothetical protein